MAHAKLNLPEKICINCQRPFAWRKKWARDWDLVKYCSERCRRSPKLDSDRVVEEANNQNPNIKSRP